MATAVEGHISVGTIDQLRERGCTVTTGGGHTIAVFFHDGQVYAVDNRCPHMGFLWTEAASRTVSSPATGITLDLTCPAAARSTRSPTMSAVFP